MATRKYKVRFHLGKGENFMKWRVENTTTKNVEFFNVDDFSITLNNCKLYNQKSAANKIHEGANKTVCAWIMAEEFLYTPEAKNLNNTIKYNPRETPHWISQEKNNMDGETFSQLVIINKTITYGNK